MRVAGLILAVVAAIAAIWWLARDLLPPERVRFAAGSEGGGYHRIAQKYQTILAKDGIEVEILITAGSVENARLLADGTADVGLLQGGVPAGDGLESLGNIFLEPFFVFVRAAPDAAPVPANVAKWTGLRLAAGGAGSGTRAAFLSLARAAGLKPDRNRILPLGGKDAAKALLAGEVDAALFVAPLDAPYLADLYRAETARMLTLAYLPALTSRLVASEQILLPAGAIRLDPPVPRQDTEMLAMVARLAAPPDLHPALVARLVAAARALHTRRSPIHDEGAFPNMETGDLPPDPYARDLLRTGPSVLQRYLPYWMVAQINRVAILLLPIVFLLLPLLRALPGLYAWRMRARVYSHYQDIRAIETAAEKASDPEALAAFDRQLAAIDEDLARLRLPLPYRNNAYTARMHVDLARRRIADRIAAPGGRGSDRPTLAKPDRS